MRARLVEFSRQPLISVLMPTYNTPAEWLRSAVESVLRQVYGHWELCIADDGSTASHTRELLEGLQRSNSRVRVRFASANQGIATASNAALKMARGEFVAFLDHDDELRADALFQVVAELNRHPKAELIYTDEDKIDQRGGRVEPYFKPDWNYDLFLSHNLITHLAVFRTQRVKELGGLRAGFDGAQDYDLALRFIEGLPEERIRHIPKLLYHWRKHSGSTASSPAAKDYAPLAARRAISEHLHRRGVDAEVLPAPEVPHCHSVRYTLPRRQPLVTLIIPTRNNVNKLKACIRSLQRTTYLNFEVLIVDNGSDDEATLAYLQELAAAGTARVLRPTHGLSTFGARQFRRAPRARRAYWSAK